MNPIYQFLKDNKLTTKDEKTFEKDYSDRTKAKELHSFFSTNKLTEKDFDSFYNEYFKKKEVSEPVSSSGGTLGISEAPLEEKPPKGFEGLKPAKIQPTQVFEEKGVREDTMLTRKMERAQKQAILGTEVRLPAAPKAVAAERGMQRAVEPMVEKSTRPETQSWLSNTVSALDRGFYKNLIGNPMLGLSTIIKYGTSAMTGGRVKEGPISDALSKMGNWFNNAIDEVAPQDPEFKNSLSDQFAQALGQVGSMVLTGGIGAGGRTAAGVVPKVAPKVPVTEVGKKLAPIVNATKGAAKELVSEIASPAAISAGLSMGQSEFEKAKQAGASDDQAFEAFYKNAAVGSILEKIPVMQFLKRFNKSTQGGVANYIKTKGVAGVTGGMEELTTEVLQQLYANKTAQDIYNVNQNIFEGLAESGGIGFGVGFLLNAMGARAKVLRNEGKEAEAKVVEDQVKEFESRASKGAAAAEPQVPPTPTPTTETVSRIETEFKPVEKAPKVSAAPIEAFRDVESTTKALNKFRWDNPKVEKITELSPNIYAEFEGIAEDYHQFKKEGSNPEFVKAVEDLLVGEVAPEAAPQVPTTEEKTYRVEYFDPETRKMTHQMFATEAEGEAFKKTLTREQTSQGVRSYFEKAPAKGVGEVVTEAAPQAPATPEAQKESIQNVIKQEGLDISPNQLDRLYDEAVKGGGKIEDSQIRKILNVGYLKAIRIAEDINDLGVGEVAPEAAPQVPAAPKVEDKKADIERRRQDELSKYPNLYKNAKTKEELQKVVKDWLDLDIFSQQDSTPNVRSALYTPGGFERGKELFLEERKQNIDDFNNRLNAKYDAELASLGVGEVAPEAAPQVPAAPEKTQDEVAKEQTIETDLLLGGQAEQRRKDGKYTKDGVEYVRNPKGQGIASEVAGEVRFTNEVSLPFKYKLVEAETLQPSHQDGIRNPLHFIPEAQPKNRNDVGSLQAEESFANNPRFSELGENTNAYSGAPVVNERGEVVQGNNRSAGLRKGYKRNNPQYKNDLAANAEQFGFTREQVEGMKNPVLVREIAVSDQGAIELGNYDAKDLETGGKRRVDPIAVTRRMPFDVKGRIADLFTGEETLNQAIRANQKRLLELLNPYLNQAQRNTITKEGVLTDAGIKDLEAVVQQFLFDNGDTALPDLFENLSATQKEGLRKSLPYVFSVSPEKSLVPDIQEAILAVNDFNASGAGEFDAWLLQGDIFNDGKTPKDKYTPLELAIAKTLVESKTQKEIAKKFADYADVVKDKEADMFEAARPGRSRKEGVLEIFKTEDYAKPISERGRKEVTPKEKPTPKPSPEKRAGDAARSLAEKIRAGKINKEGFRASTGFDVVWDAALEIVASSLEAGASVADAVQDGLKYIRTTDWYKNLTDKKDFEDKFTNRLNEEYNAIQVGGPEEVPVGEAPRGREKVEPGVPPTKPPKAPKKGKTQSEKDLDKLANNVPDTGKVDEYLSKGTIEKYTGETPENSQARGVQELRIALEHGDKIIEKAKEAFGKDYVEKTLEYIEESTAAASNKALMYVSLENALGKEKLANPDRAGEITKLQALVYAKSQEFAREASLALNYQKLRKVAQVGYDTSEITDTFFSSQELKDKRTLNKAIEANPDEVNAMEDEREAERIYSQEELEKKVEQGVRAEVDKLFQQLPKKSKSKAEKALTVLAKWRKQIRGRAYDATLGIPASVIDTGLAVIENAIKIGVSVEKAIDLGIKKIKEGLKGKPWPKENDFRKDMLDFYKQEGIDTKSELPSTNKQYIKEALIKQGFGRKTTIKGEEREVLDWRKLAGEAGTVERIRENVEEAMRNEGFTEQEIKDAQAEYEQEYVDLRQSIIEKAQNELARRNKTTVTSAQKSAAKRLAELYTYGLFEKNYDEYEVAMNKALGVKVSEKTFNEAKKIAEAIKSIYASTFQGVRLSDVSAKSALEKLSDNVRVLVYEQSKKQGSTPFKLASLVRRYLDFTQTMILVSFKNATENFSSGLQQKLIDKLFISMGKQTTPELIKERRRLMKDVYKDMILNGGIGYGKVETRFVNRRHLDDYVNKLSDNQLYHGIASVVTGKATLNAMDAMFKAGLTEARFTSNLIRILTDKSNPNKISKDEALKLVSETLTGQTLEKARVTAKEVIEKINKDAGEVLIKPTEEQINRFANDIVKAALEMNGVITSDQVIAAYNAAYRSAGLSVGHEPNNFFSRMIVGESAKIEGNINNAIKEKNWSNATWLTYYSIFFRNLLNPFAGGGTNWLVIKLEKTGLGLFTGLMYEKSGRKEAMDLSTKEGLARLEKRLFNESRAKDSYLRGLVGGTASLLVFAAFNGAPDDWEEKYKKWRLENKWAAKYLDLITPEMLLAQMAIDAQKTNKRAILQYAATSLNKNDALSAEEKLFKAVDYAAQGDSPRAYGALGEALGARINTPLPWRLVRDGQILYQGIKGEDPYHGNYKPSIGFWSGVLQGGAIEWAGLRPVYEGNVDVSYFKVKDPETRKEREITEKERIGVRDLANRRYAALMNEYKRGEKGIWRDINNKLHISKKSQSGSETVTWREVGYKNLNKEDIRTLEDLIRKQSLNDAKKEFQFDRGAVAQ